MYTTATTSTYIVTLLLIAAHSEKLEPVSNQVEEVNKNVKAISDHINKLTHAFQSHRDNTSNKVEVICEIFLTNNLGKSRC